ncbi:hypothetical protein [Lysobacter gummosus]|uniref:hypothetical protein n=1 Tax=Lysobacter gummosus TaxID=262324 RepID=UPI003639E211
MGERLLWEGASAPMLSYRTLGNPKTNSPPQTLRRRACLQRTSNQTRLRRHIKRDRNHHQRNAATVVARSFNTRALLFLAAVPIGAPL